MKTDPACRHGKLRRVVTAGRIIYLLFCLQALVLSIQAQISHSPRKENFDVHEFDTEMIHINARAHILQLRNMSGITVMDARADTSAVGFMQKKVIDPFFGAFSNASKNQTEQRINKKPTFIVLGNGLQQQSAHYLQQSVVFSNDATMPGILMVIKKLWLSDELCLVKSERNSSRFDGAASKDAWTSGIDARIEFYLRDQSGYYPMYRYDSIITEAMTVSEYGQEFIERALRLSVQKMAQMDIKIPAIMHRTKFSFDEIIRHNQSDFDLPALKDTVYRPGVYLSFEEFKNNIPSLKSFELRKEKLTDILYIRQPDGKEWVARDVWGYCDGKHAFIKSGDNFFLLQRQENAFYIFGAKNTRRTETASSGAVSSYSGTGFSTPYYYTTSRTAIQLEPFQLDWGTGNLY